MVSNAPNFSSLLSKHLSTAFGSLQSRYSSTPQPQPLPLKQSPTFSDPYKFNQETLQWSPTTLSSGSYDPDQRKIRIFSWDIGPLFTSGDPGTLAKAIATLKSLVPTSQAVLILLRNVPARLLPSILAHPFIRSSFLTSDVNALSWPGLGPGKPAHSGTVVLVDHGSMGALQTIFRVRTAFGESGEGGEDVCFVDLKMGNGTIGRVGVLSGSHGAGFAGEWANVEGVTWGVVTATESLESEMGLEYSKGGIFWRGKCEISSGDVDDAEKTAGEFGLRVAHFTVTV